LICLYHGTRTSTNCSAVSLSRDIGDTWQWYYDTALPLVKILVMWYCNVSIILSIISLKNTKYDLFKTWNIIPNLMYIYMVWYNFDTVLYKFLETGTSGRTLICLDQLLKCLGFSLYPPSCFLNSPLNIQKHGQSLKYSITRKVP